MTTRQRQVDSKTPQVQGEDLSLSVNPLPEPLEGIAHEIALDMQAHLAELAEGWYDRMVAVPELARWAAPELKELALHNARLDIGREVNGLVNGRRLPSHCPPEVIDSARLGASMNYPLWAALQAYRAGHAVQWQAWSTRIETRNLDPADRRLLLRAGSDYMFAYADHSARWMELEYTRARDERMRSDEQRRIQLVRNLLDGHSTEATQLDYDLDAWHLGLIAAGTDAEKSVREMGSRAGCQLLAVAVDAITWWAWLGFTERPSAPTTRKLLAIEVPAAHTIALGEPGHGARGFVQTHREAQRTANITSRRGTNLNWHDEVALEDLATADPDRAALFTERELGPLANDDRRAKILRDTLHAYFATAETASAAARLLNVHERTIGNRLRTIEQLTGRPVSQRHAELETALRLHRLLSQ